MSEEGASYREQILDAARRNNTDLLASITEALHEDQAQLAAVINESQDALGNTPLHLAAQNGSFEVLDVLLDVEGVELDHHNRLDGDTPLHCAVRYAEEEPEHGAFIAETLVEAGADARVKNSGGLKPIDLIRGENDALRDTLQSAEYAFQLEQEEQAREATIPQGGDDDDEGSGSDSGDE